MRRLVLCWTVLLLAGCSFAPEYQRPKMEMPSAWRNEVQGETPDVRWWRRFEDPVLTELVEEALTANRDIAAAAARVDYARSQLGLARAEQLPLLSGQGRAVPTWVDNTRAGVGESTHAGLFNAAWELDFWGKYRNAAEAARAQLLGTEAAQAGMRLSIAAQTANGYFLLRSLDSQLETAERTLKTREDALEIYMAQYEQGLISELDITQAKTVVETARTALYRTRASVDAAEAALQALAGRSPRAIMDDRVKRGLALEELPAPPVIPAGVPSDLLTRRPDIIQAEQTLIAANADIGVARAAWFPSISLTAMFGVISSELHTLLSNPLQTWSYGATGTVPIVDFGRVLFSVEGAEARQREAAALYEKTVQEAFRDIRDALARQREADNIVRSLEKSVEQYRLARDLARSRYDNGYSSYLEVLDAERSLFQSEMDLASARSDRLTAVVNVCLALGGGWK